MNLYPLKFQPLIKSKIWGGTRLGTLYNKPLGKHRHAGESWELSGLEGDRSIVVNGFLADNDIAELIEVYMGELVGDAVYEKYGTELPLLFKIIDANDNLSVQVHPDDDLARELHDTNGKSEFWYVLHVEPGASIIAGLKNGVTREQLQASIEQGTITEQLNSIPVNVGDVINIPAGLVHSLGKGVVVAEIQQASDITYRLYDYERVDKEGNKRELHIDNALKAIDFDDKNSPCVQYERQINGAVNIVRNDYFTTNLITFDRVIQRDYAALDSFVVYICAEGVCTLNSDDNVMTIKAGETVMLPATTTDITLKPLVSQPVKMLETYVEI